MENLILKREKSLLRGLLMGFLMTAAFVLLTNCASKSVVSTSAGSMQRAELQPSADYALLHFYRPGSMMGMAISYDLYLENDVVFRVKNKSKTTLKITSEGLKTLWAKTESKTELPVDIKLGQEYYIQCGLGMGVLVGRPRLEIVDNKTGKGEFAKIPASKK
jgi:hypothetical protein